jgi:predicted RNase H-like nuclease (RuvC/YqgF family)
LKALKKDARTQWDAIAIASTDYVTDMYNLHQACQAEYKRQRERNEEANMKVAGMRFNLEQERKATREHEEEFQKREYEMERVMREQSRKIDQIEAELKHARDTMEVGQTTSAIYRDTVEANQRRLEVEGAVQRNKIYSLLVE